MGCPGLLRYVPNIYGYRLDWIKSYGQALMTQMNIDQSMVGLLSKISQVYAFIIEEALINIGQIKEPVMAISKLISTCVRFIQSYPEARTFCMLLLKVNSSLGSHFFYQGVNLRKNVLHETNKVVFIYSNALDVLMQQCWGIIKLDLPVSVNRLLDDISHILDDIYAGKSIALLCSIYLSLPCADDRISFSQLAYVNGVGLDTTKLCMEGTRTDLLQHIIDWVNGSEVDTEHILWLYGEAGRGKSAIAHTIASWFKDLGALGSCFCFIGQQANYLHEKIFSTIAYDLADHVPGFRRFLNEVIVNNPALATTLDVVQQWEKFVVYPISKVSARMIGRVIIVIDGLDESGNESSRNYILNILTSVKAARLPANFHILITSRPLPDIIEALHATPHIRDMSLNDISIATTERDVHLYISNQLGGLMDVFSVKQISALVQLSDGLFEWARLACEFIKGYRADFTAIEQYEKLILYSSGNNLLDGMYLTILREIVGSKARPLERFKSVMQQILWTQEPLPMNSLDAIRHAFPSEVDVYEINIVLNSMGALLSGIADKSTPVHPLHSSFYDFLMDPTRSVEFALNIKDMHPDLSLACLQVMQAGLCFNICQLENSYLPDLWITDLDWRVQKYIPAHLSYACRFWVVHVQKAEFMGYLAQEVELLLKDKLLFWIEALSLLKVLNGVPSHLASIASWLEVCL